MANYYSNSLELARDYNIESIAFPLISSGAFGYPKDKALSTAISTIGDFLLNNEMLVFLVVYDKTAFVEVVFIFKTGMEVSSLLQPSAHCALTAYDSMVF